MRQPQITTTPQFYTTQYIPGLLYTYKRRKGEGLGAMIFTHISLDAPDVAYGFEVNEGSGTTTPHKEIAVRLSRLQVATADYLLEHYPRAGTYSVVLATAVAKTRRFLTGKGAGLVVAQVAGFT